MTQTPDNKKKSWYSRRGLRGKFFLLVIPVSALAVILYTVLVVEVSNQQREAQNREVAESIGRRDARLLAPVLWNIDFEGQRRILEVIGNEERLRCLKVYEYASPGPDAQVELASTGRCESVPAACIGQNAQPVAPACQAASIYRVKTPIIHQVGTRENIVGQAIHWIDVSRQQDDVLQEVLGFSLLSILMYSLLGISITIGFRRVLFQPIHAMDEALEDYRKTGKRKKVDWESEDELGKIIHGYNDSVDRQNRVEEELKLARDQAQKALDELRVAKDNLVQAEKLASLGSLVAGIAHEINTPVGSSLTVATTLSERVKQFRLLLEQGALRKSELEDFISQTEEAAHIMGLSLQAAGEQIQKFKQVAVDQTSASRRRFNLAVVTEEVLSTLRPRIKRTEINLIVKVDPDIWLDSYPGPFGQVLSNLFTNAITHGFDDQGRGEIVIEAHALNDSEVAMSFSDNGVGMTDKQVQRLYDPFFTTRMGRGGSGLGMHVVYNVVTTILMGKIQVVSAPGEGTTVTLTVPLDPPQREPANNNKEEGA